MGYTGSPNFGTINATPKQLYTVTVSSNNIGLRSTYLSTSSTATSGSSSLNVPYGTTVYGFAVLESDVKADKVSG